MDEATLFTELVALTKRYVETVNNPGTPPLVDLVCTLEAVAENLIPDFVPEANAHVTSAQMSVRF